MITMLFFFCFFVDFLENQETHKTSVILRSRTGLPSDVFAQLTCSLQCSQRSSKLLELFGKTLPDQSHHGKEIAFVFTLISKMKVRIVNNSVKSFFPRSPPKSPEVPRMPPNQFAGDRRFAPEC